MATAKLIYTGGLHTEATHLESGTVILTDAPKDNQGNGAAFSPTDLVATALASCILTTMGIVARRENIKIEGSTAEVVKVMYPDPRRIGEIHVKLDMSMNTFSDKEKKLMENTAHACPVAKSLHPDLKQILEFIY